MFKLYITDTSGLTKEFKNGYLDKKFSGGELNMRLNDLHLSLVSASSYTISSNATKSDDIMGMLLLNNLVENVIKQYKFKDIKKILHIKYLPYGRQDRICNEGEPFSLEVYANLINTMNMDSVVIEDPHSFVALDLIKKFFG